MLKVTVNKLTGVMDKNLKWVAKPVYKLISKYQSGYAIVADSNGKHGAIDEKGNLTTPINYPLLLSVSKAYTPYALVKNGVSSDKSGMINLATGKLVIPVSYDFYAYDYYDGFIVFRRDGKKGMIDSAGMELFYGTYDDFSPGFMDGMAWVKKDGLYGFINQKGELAVPLQYESVKGFEKGTAVVKLNGKYGMINKKGEMILPAVYDEIGSFYEDYATVKQHPLYGYVDISGKLVIKPAYNFAGPFEGGSAWVQFGLLNYYINKEGKILK